MSKPSITICSSANFYQQAVEIQEQLQNAGYTVLIPDMAQKMKDLNDFDVSHHKSWFADPNDYHKKAALMHGHFDKVDKGDVCLILNFEKNGRSNYIGGNVLMEMALAFHARKPIFLWNEMPDESPFLEEILGMNPTPLHGKAENLLEALKEK